MHCLGRYTTILVTGALLAGCGGQDEPPAQTIPAATVALGQDAQRSGEVVVRGEASPMDFGPYELRGSYVARFEQSAPEDPALDFGTQVAFSAQLVDATGREVVELFTEAAPEGRAVVRLDGEYRLSVSFGDFPFAVRLTPR